MSPRPVLGCGPGSGIPLWPRGSGKPQHLAVSSSKDFPACFLFLSVSIGSSLKIICNARHCSAEFPSGARGTCREASLDQRPREGPGARARLKFRSILQIQSSSTKKAAVLLRLCWTLEEAAGNVEFPLGLDRGWENGEEQQEFRPMVSDTAGSGGCPQKSVFTVCQTKIPLPRACS